MPNCCVCGNTVTEHEMYTSTVVSEKKPYCLTCISSGFEPYDDLVSYGFDYDMFSESFRERILNPTIRRNRKSIEQFNADVETRQNMLASSEPTGE